MDTSPTSRLPKLAVSRSPAESKMAFQYLWLKYVTGFDPNTHCQPCLLGEKSRYVSLRMRPRLWYPMNEAPAPYLYLCASFGTYETNVHAAAQAAIGERFEVPTASGAVFYFENMRRVDIPSPPKDVPSHFTRKQTTCRNWWFGYAQWPVSRRATG